MEIREAQPGEYPVVGAVAVEGYRDAYGTGLGYYADHLRDVASRSSAGVVLVAVEAGEILATATYVPDPSSRFAEQQREEEASIRMLAVAPEHKRRGIGSALSAECIERARAERKRAIVVHADEIMTCARSLYEGLGFRRDESRDFAPDEETFLVCYVLDL